MSGIAAMGQLGRKQNQRRATERGEHRVPQHGGRKQNTERGPLDPCCSPDPGNAKGCRRPSLTSASATARPRHVRAACHHRRTVIIPKPIGGKSDCTYHVVIP